MLRADESDTPLTPPESGHLQVTRQNTWPGCTEQEACSSLAAAAHSPNVHAALFHSMKEKHSQIDKLLTCTSSLRLGGQQVSGHVLERAELCAVKREIGVTCRSYEKKLHWFQLSVAKSSEYIPGWPLKTRVLSNLDSEEVNAQASEGQCLVSSLSDFCTLRGGRVEHKAKEKQHLCPARVHGEDVRLKSLSAAPGHGNGDRRQAGLREISQQLLGWNRDGTEHVLMKKHSFRHAKFQTTPGDYAEPTALTSSPSSRTTDCPRSEAYADAGSGYTGPCIPPRHTESRGLEAFESLMIRTPSQPSDVHVGCMRPADMAPIGSLVSYVRLSLSDLHLGRYRRHKFRPSAILGHGRNFAIEPSGSWRLARGSVLRSPSSWLGLPG
ncbi:hypothetical protein AXG93_150s1100 [Marchantia polymorpha subsp. ruderalis]|uniref:Uncharacterized protein n=1 Tax=Marchantia polymorpha subsp. ruderalis TaxID=1480154 RepID=A0A176WD56_MARPO|nr:hypothetical protein AXG93_150s1100 [Marchantia polymorpha subsp. ruderalis]